MKTYPIEKLRELVDHDAQTGVMFWRARKPYHFVNGKRSSTHRCNNWNSRYAGTRAFNALSSLGYYFGALERDNFFAHRVIWALHYDAWPEYFIDHINHVGTDNRIKNLRSATHAENMMNQSSRVGSSSPFLGVCWDAGKRKWAAQIRPTSSGKRFLGRFDDEIKAAKAYDEAARVAYGEFANLNFPQPEDKQ